MTTLRLATTVLLLPGIAPAADWPGWRGPTGDGHAVAKPPLRWSPTENVRWKVPLSGPGNSSPVVWKDRIFITQAQDKGARRAVLCFDRADGKLLWQRDVPFAGDEPTHNTNPLCSATPVTDGERVIASHGAAGLVCYDFAGRELWRKDLGTQEHIWGTGSSPILYRSLAVIWCGVGERQVLVAVDKATGRTVWEHAEPGGNAGHDNKNWRGSWATPVVVRVGDHDEMILPVPEAVKAFDPATGRELWSCAGLGKLAYPTPVMTADGVVVALSGYHGPALAVRAGGRGDVTATHRLWHHTAKIPQRIGSPVIVGGHAYLLNENGLAQCFEVATGTDVWNKERASGGSWGSFVLAGGRLYVTNLAGETLVLAASPEFKVLARNPLGERTLASPAVADGDIVIRTYKHLWCIGGANSNP